MDCWICGQPAPTGEHLIKASDLKSYLINGVRDIDLNIDTLKSITLTPLIFHDLMLPTWGLQGTFFPRGLTSIPCSNLTVDSTWTPVNQGVEAVEEPQSLFKSLAVRGIWRI